MSNFDKTYSAFQFREFGMILAQVHFDTSAHLFSLPAPVNVPGSFSAQVLNQPHAARLAVAHCPLLVIKWTKDINY